MPDNTTNRESLTKVAHLVRPALANQSYIPALTHIRFDGEYATAYNDVAAITVRAEVPIKRCIPGGLLIRALESFGGESVLLQANDKDGSLVVSSGRSKIKLPTLPNKDFPLTLPEDGSEVAVNADMLKGIEHCLIAVGTDPTHPQQMGVTLDQEGGKAVLFSTDNFTLSRYQTKTKIKLPGDAPIILPTFFCEQLVSLSKAFPTMVVTLLLHAGSIVAEFGDEKKPHAVLFTKTLVDLEPRDFGKAIAKHIKVDKVVADLKPIPDQFDAAFGRALLVQSMEIEKSTEVTVGKEKIGLHSSSAMGDADDTMAFEGGDSKAFVIDPSLVVRASKSCASIAFCDGVVVFGNKDGTFLHLVAHCAK